MWSESEESSEVQYTHMFNSDEEMNQLNKLIQAFDYISFFEQVEHSARTIMVCR